jgi:hypothetical protein
MSTGQTLGSRIVAGDLMIQLLLNEADLIGGIYTMGFDECVVLTNDLWKSRAGGVPQHCFLLATAMEPNQSPRVEDEEILLLRVVGPAALPAEAELVQLRAEAMREIVTERGSAAARSEGAILDVLTRNEIQFSAFKAKVLGTFYDAVGQQGSRLEFGSDVQSFFSASHYKVYKPYGQSLSIIASYPEPSAVHPASGSGSCPCRSTFVQIGTIRYSSTRRRRDDAGARGRPVPVRVNVEDFIAMKTAVFGMTRLGKSNTMKTIATAVCQYAAETGQPIGQLLFDPAGEYANVNVQDRTALSQIGSDYVTIFRYGSDGSEPGIRPLSTNFFRDENIEVTWSIISSYLRPRNDSIYIRNFLAADVIGPENEQDDRSAYNRARRRRAALYATLRQADFPSPGNFSCTFLVNATVLRAVNAKVNQAQQQFSTNRGVIRTNAQELVRFWRTFHEAWEDRANLPANDTAELEDWADTGLQAILTVFTASTGAGYRLLTPARVYHSASQTSDYAADVLNHLVQGRIVIVDLSLGTESVLQFCSERIVNYILNDAARRFASGQEPHRIQIFIEEAHRLFNRDRMKAPEEADPYVRLAKEAAKYRIGLICATQEVSSVDPIILSNTSNWIVTHLNNKAEVRELSKYYDFEDFSELTLKAEDVGFARIKTRSGRYIIPSQIDLFDEDRVQQAREAVERAAVNGEGQGEA